ERESGGVADGALIRIKTCEDVDVRRQRDHVVRVRVGEAHSLRGDAIEEWRLHARVPGEADRVGAQRVDRNQDDVVGFRGGGGFFGAVAAEEGDGEEKGDGAPHPALRATLSQGRGRWPIDSPPPREKVPRRG